jgi:hypothetical protein
VEITAELADVVAAWGRAEAPAIRPAAIPALKNIVKNVLTRDRGEKLELRNMGSTAYT